MHVGEAEIPAGAPECQFLVIEAQQRQNRCMQVVHVHFVFDRLKSKLIGRAVHIATADAAACHPHGKTVVIVIAAIDLASV